MSEVTQTSTVDFSDVFSDCEAAIWCVLHYMSSLFPALMGKLKSSANSLPETTLRKPSSLNALVTQVSSLSAKFRLMSQLANYGNVLAKHAFADFESKCNAIVAELDTWSNQAAQLRLEKEKGAADSILAHNRSFGEIASSLIGDLQELHAIVTKRVLELPGVPKIVQLVDGEDYYVCFSELNALADKRLCSRIRRLKIDLSTKQVRCPPNGRSNSKYYSFKELLAECQDKIEIRFQDPNWRKKLAGLEVPPNLVRFNPSHSRAQDPQVEVELPSKQPTKPRPSHGPHKTPKPKGGASVPKKPRQKTSKK